MRVQNPLGRSGESYARNYLEAKGYQFVEANWHCPVGEIDLVMTDGSELVLVEVKTRRSENAGSAEESVGRSKSRRSLQAGAAYVARHPQYQSSIWRIDLVAVSIDSGGKVGRLSHIENAVLAG